MEFCTHVANHLTGGEIKVLGAILAPDPSPHPPMMDLQAHHDTNFSGESEFDYEMGAWCSF